MKILAFVLAIGTAQSLFAWESTACNYSHDELGGVVRFSTGEFYVTSNFTGPDSRQGFYVSVLCDFEKATGQKGYSVNVRSTSDRWPFSSTLTSALLCVSGDTLLITRRGSTISAGKAHDLKEVSFVLRKGHLEKLLSCKPRETDDPDPALIIDGNDHLIKIEIEESHLKCIRGFVDYIRAGI